MRAAVLLLASVVVLAGCVTSDQPPETPDPGPEPATEISTLNRTYAGSITGAGTPAGSVNQGGSDSLQTIDVNASAIRIHVNVTITTNAPESEARIGFYCSQDEQGATSCEERHVTEGHELSWSDASDGEDFGVSIFWDQGAGEMQWTIEATQIIEGPVPATT